MSVCVSAGEKPYECPSCHRRFSQLTHVQAHQKTSCKGVPYVPKVGKRRKRARTTESACQTGSPALHASSSGSVSLTTLSPPPISALSFAALSSSSIPALSTISLSGTPFHHHGLQGTPPTLPTMVPPPPSGSSSGLPQYQTFGHEDASKRKKAAKKAAAAAAAAQPQSSSEEGGLEEGLDEAAKSTGCQTNAPTLRVKLMKMGQCCEICNKEFRYISALQRHMRSHTGQWIAGGKGGRGGRPPVIYLFINLFIKGL